MRLWVLATCALLLGAAAPSPSLDPQNGAGGQQGPQNGQSVAAPDALVPSASAVPDALKAVIRDANPAQEDEAKAAEDRQRDKDQLEADQSAARWAMVAALAALAGLPLSAVGIWLVWGTLRATQTAVGEAANATQAAKDAVEVTEATAHTQLRPYVYVAAEGIEIDSVVGLISNVGKASVTIQNYGQTPAKNVTLQARCIIGGHWTDDFAAELDDVALIYVDDMPPGFFRTKDVYYVTGIVAAQSDIRNADAAIFFEGLISYADASGQAYETRFRRACMGDDLDRGAFIITGHGNGAT